MMDGIMMDGILMDGTRERESEIDDYWSFFMFKKSPIKQYYAYDTQLYIY